jgi:hypothetical protein
LLIEEAAFPFVIAKVSDDEDDDADGDAESEKLSQSQSMDTASDKPDTPHCQLRSGIAYIN